MAKTTKGTTARGKQRRGRATKRTQSATKKTKRVAAKKMPGRRVGKAKPRIATKKTTPKKPQPQPAQQGASTETVIVDVIEEPVPGVMVVSEFEATRVQDSEEEE
jgi:hypothetical protein